MEMFLIKNFRNNSRESEMKKYFNEAFHPGKRDMPNEQIPLSEEGKALAVSKRNIFSNVDRCFSSPYRRAMETAEFIADHPVIVKELHEKNDRGMPGRISG